MILKELLENTSRDDLNKKLKTLMARRKHIESNSSEQAKPAELKHIDKLISDVKFDLDDHDLSDKFK